MVERGKLNLAAQCLERAAILAPELDYVHRHLAIVKARVDRLTPEELGDEVFDDSFWAEPLESDTNNAVMVEQSVAPTGSSTAAKIYQNPAETTPVAGEIGKTPGKPLESIPEFRSDGGVFERIVNADATDLEIGAATKNRAPSTTRNTNTTNRIADVE